jgi:hypothetical protein
MSELAATPVRDGSAPLVCSVIVEIAKNSGFW